MSNVTMAGIEWSPEMFNNYGWIEPIVVEGTTYIRILGMFRASLSEMATSIAEALAAANAAATSETNAGAHATDALASKNSALDSKNAAATSETNASAHAASALSSKNAAATSASTAGTHAADALASKNAAATSASTAGTHAADALASKNAAATSATTASGHATDALASKNAAATSATTASGHAADALASKNAAATSASTAGTHAADALASKNAAEAAATAAAAAAAAASTDITLLAGIDPTLDIIFSDPAGIPAGLTFTRASTATRFNKRGLLETVAANVPRIDYDPVTGECKGLLIEEARTNLLTYSRDFSSGWRLGATLSNLFTVTTGATTAPDGTTSAVKFESTPTTSQGLFLRAWQSAPAAAYTFSISIMVPTQAGVSNWSIVIDAQDSATDFAQSATYVTFDEWVRVEIPITYTSTRAFLDLNIRMNGGTPTTAGRILYAWGAQLEAGAFPTSYIPTTTTAATRAADVAVMTGANFSDWYRADEGTVVVEASRPYAPPSNTYPAPLAFTEASGSSQDSIGFFVSSGLGVYALARDGNATRFTPQIGTATAGVPFSAAFAFREGDYAATFTGGATAVGSTAGSLPVAVQMKLGSLDAMWNGHIRRLAYFPARLPNATLQAMTTE